MWEGITQGHKHQEAGILGGHIAGWDQKFLIQFPAVFLEKSDQVSLFKAVFSKEIGEV